MVLFHFRVHTDNLVLENLLGFVKSSACVLLIVKEMGDRPHIHSIIQPLKSISTFRQQFLKSFPMCKGNKCYSLEEVKDLDKLKCYLCKGDNETTLPDVLFSKDVDVDAYHKQYWEVNKSLKTHSSPQQRVKNVPWRVEVKNEFLTAYPVETTVLSVPLQCRWKPTEQEIQDYVACQKKLLGFILKKLGKSVHIIDDNIISRMYKGIQNSIIQDGHSSEKFVDYMFTKLEL